MQYSTSFYAEYIGHRNATEFSTSGHWSRSMLRFCLFLYSFTPCPDFNVFITLILKYFSLDMLNYLKTSHATVFDSVSSSHYIPFVLITHHPSLRLYIVSNCTQHHNRGRARQYRDAHFSITPVRLSSSIRDAATSRSTEQTAKT